MFEGDFLLSDFTQATWLDKGGVQLIRLKEEDETFDGGIGYMYPSRAEGNGGRTIATWRVKEIFAP